MEQVNFITSLDIYFVINNPKDANLYLKLPQFTLLRPKKISRLLKKRIFKLVNFKNVLADTRNFNLRFIDKIKNICTNIAFKNSCLVIQAYNNLNKDFVLTQLPTI